MDKQPTAFPTVDANRELDYGTTGMTLRDYFAAKAIPAILEQMDVCNGKELTSSAWIAYQLADAMMEVRNG